MSPTAAPTAARPTRKLWRPLLAGLPVAVAVVVGLSAGATNRPGAGAGAQPDGRKKVAAPELEGGVAWLNTGGPVSLKKDLKGKVVLLDFWTLCCINCIHIQP